MPASFSMLISATPTAVVAGTVNVSSTELLGLRVIVPSVVQLPTASNIRRIGA